MDTFYEKELESIERQWRDRFPEQADKFSEQYLLQGFHDGETFDLSMSLAKLILPRLRCYRELAKGKIEIEFPLDDMIEAFEALEEIGYDRWSLEGERLEKINRGLKAFGEHFLYLWW